MFFLPLEIQPTKFGFQLKKMSESSSKSPNKSSENITDQGPNLDFKNDKVKALMKHHCAQPTSFSRTTTVKSHHHVAPVQINDAAVAAVNLALTEFIKKLAHETTLTSLKEATKNKQSKLPLDVEYRHLAETVGNLDDNTDFKKKIKRYFPQPVTLEQLRKDKTDISTKLKMTQ